MEQDNKEARQRYAQLSTEELVGLLRSPRLPTADAKVVEDVLDMRGVSKVARENIKYAMPIAADTVPTEQRGDYAVHKDFAARPRLVALIALLSAWGVISNLFSMFDAVNVGPKFYFLVFAILNAFVAYGLWLLKPWARKFLLFTYSLNLLMLWAIVLLIYFLNDTWKLSVEELARSASSLGPKQVVQALVLKGIVIGALIKSAIYAAAIGYFFRPHIRQLFR